MPAPQPVNVVHNVVVNSQKDDCCKSEGASCGGNCPAAGGFGLCGASACAFSFGHIWGRVGSIRAGMNQKDPCFGDLDADRDLLNRVQM
uniref:CC domain-containing protein n=1 Tax=Steinernema glaseri TaxID=37863 RepID=A0A1I7ZY73_9BILA